MAILEQDPSALTQDRVEIAKSLFGILPADITLEDARKERLKQVVEKQE